MGGEHAPEHHTARADGSAQFGRFGQHRGGAWAQTHSFTGPISPYYLNNNNEQTIYVVQGTSVINSFPWNYTPGCTNSCEGNLAISNGHVNTNWLGNALGSPGIAGQYTLNGTPTGVTWPNSSPPAGTLVEGIFDGTSDGSLNYTVQNWPSTSPLPQKVVATDLQWQNSIALFDLPFNPSNGSITYDPVDNALWIGISGQIAKYSLTGTLLAFASSGPIGDPTALAYDPADDTLWFSDHGLNFIVQISKAGELLQFGTPTGLPGSSYLAGEIAGQLPPPPTVPEPGSLGLLGTGLAGLWAALRRRNRRPA